MNEKINAIATKGKVKTANCFKRFIDWGGPTSGIGYLLQGDVFNAIMTIVVIFILAILVEIYYTRIA